MSTPVESGSPIRLLAPDVAAKIAAGEVVERPANAVKELIENSLDAGANEIRVELREGGRRLLRVVDDGHGMRREEAGLAFLRHSTSKLHSADDLAAIGTFGFRGEALYSIAAVSHTTLVTRHRSEEAGTQLIFDAGTLISQSSVGAPTGTSVTVEHLFHNMPARQKFLRAAATEAGQITALVQRLALAWPGVRFSCTSDGKVVFRSSGSGKLFDVLVQVLGLEATRQMVALAPETSGATRESDPAAEISFDDDESPYGPGAGLESGQEVSRLRIDGAVGLPSLHRANRGEIRLYVNGRAVEDRSLTHAVVQAYHTLLPVGRYPVAVVLIEVDPAVVDVNVHPQKLQVRFADERRLFSAVQTAVRRAVIGNMLPPSAALLGSGSAPQALTPSGSPPAQWWQASWQSQRNTLFEPDGRTFAATSAAPSDAGEAVVSERATEGEDAGAASSPGAAPPDRLPPLRVVGQIGATYIVGEGPNGMVLIDQHAAHERILYEQFMNSRYGLAGGEPPRQHLLAPVTLHAGTEIAGQVVQHQRELEAVGFLIEPFGGDSYLLRAVPAVLAGEDPEAGLLDILDAMAAGRSLVGEAYEAQLVKMVCKRAAIKAGQLLSDIEMQELLRQLEECRAPRTCPHGRPTMIQLSAGELQKAFGRI